MKNDMNNAHDPSKDSLSRYFKIVYAALAFFFGAGTIITLVLGENSLHHMVIPIGILMLLAGSTNSAEYIFSKRPYKPSPAVMAEGIATIVISLFPLIEGAACVLLLPSVLEMWELFSGSVKTAEALELRERRVKIWWLPLTIGALELFAGLGELIGPFFFDLDHALVIAAVMIMQCAGYIIQLILHGK